MGLSYLASIFHKSGKSEGEVQWEGGSGDLPLNLV